SPGAIMEHFTLNFTITNLMFTTDLQTPSSRKFHSSEKIMKHYVSQNSVFTELTQDYGVPVFTKTFPCQIDPLLQKSSIGPHFTGCSVTGFRSGRHRDDTKVDAVCSYKDNASLASFDREKLYQDLNNMTNNVTKLGHYSLDRSSLYVDG
ncbi:MUC16 protein, partial [Cinclus mexicanus]|nr:MUC16 protein [Cinclus mexicanus]